MSNSKLISYTKISPNRTSPRNHKTDTMTIPVGVDETGKLYTGKDPDVNQLKDELQNKLPKSPSNWEQWTAKEQAVARERMGVVSSDEVSTMITDALGVIENGSY